MLVDRPFAGALVRAKHYQCEPSVQAVMIEVNRRLYMDKETGKRLLHFGDVRRAISKILVVAARCSQ